MLLSVRNLTKTYPTEEGPLQVLSGVSFDVTRGESLALTGESGSGKSTLLHILGGLDHADGGEVAVEGRDIAGFDDDARALYRRTGVGLVFQQFNLIPSMTVGENLSFHARLAGREDTRWTSDLASRLGLSEHLKRYPEQLSGGQQQRVAVGRTLAARPPLVLADEPTGNLDQATGDAVIDILLELVAETGAALVIVTHSDRLATRMSRRLHLSQGQLA